MESRKLGLESEPKAGWQLARVSVTGIDEEEEEAGARHHHQGAP